MPGLAVCANSCMQQGSNELGHSNEISSLQQLRQKLSLKQSDRQVRAKANK